MYNSVFSCALAYIAAIGNLVSSDFVALEILLLKTVVKVLYIFLYS